MRAMGNAHLPEDRDLPPDLSHPHGDHSGFAAAAVGSLLLVIAASLAIYIIAIIH